MRGGGNPVILPDSAEMPFAGLRTYGRTQQRTTTGAQLFDASKIPSKTESNVILTNNGDGSFTIKDSEEGSTGAFGVYYTYSVKESIKLFPAGTYKISFDDVAPYYYVQAVNKADDAVISHVASQNRTATMTITDEMVESENYRIRIGFYKPNGMNATNKTVWPIIQKGTEAPTEWETFTGGIPSPNPDYPQELASAGNKGNIETVVAGKNLFDADKYVETALTKNTRCEVVQFDGRRCLHIPDRLSSQDMPIFTAFREGTRYTIKYSAYIVSYNTDDGNGFAFYYADDFRGFVLCRNSMHPTGKWCDVKGVSKDGDTPISLYATYGSLSECYIDLDSIQLEEGIEATSYEPSRPLQTLTMSTPNGLPGIPVSSGGNYTDENGQQWVADYRDWERGVDVKYSLQLEFDGSNGESWGIYDNPTYYGFYLSNALPVGMNRRNGYCSQLRIDAVGMETDNGLWIGVSGNRYIYIICNSFYDETLEDKGLANWKAHLAEHPLEIMTYLDDPIETPIPADELAAYRELHTNYPTTIITNDEECHMEVGYVADTENYIHQNYVPRESYNALEQRVAAIEAQVINNI